MEEVVSCLVGHGVEEAWRLTCALLIYTNNDEAMKGPEGRLRHLPRGKHRLLFVGQLFKGLWIEVRIGNVLSVRTRSNEDRILFSFFCVLRTKNIATANVIFAFETRDDNVDVAVVKGGPSTSRVDLMAFAPGVIEVGRCADLWARSRAPACDILQKALLFLD